MNGSRQSRGRQEHNQPPMVFLYLFTVIWMGMTGMFVFQSAAELVHLVDVLRVEVDLVDRPARRKHLDIHEITRDLESGRSLPDDCPGPGTKKSGPVRKPISPSLH